MEGQGGVTMEWPASTYALIETTSDTKTREYFSVYNNPLVQLPHATNTTFHFQMEGQPGAQDWVFTHPSDVASEFGPTTPFSENYLGKVIFE